MATCRVEGGGEEKRKEQWESSFKEHAKGEYIRKRGLEKKKPEKGKIF